MLRGLYTSASGMLSTQLGMDTLANNLANINTIGYKSMQANYKGFKEMLMSRISQDGNAEVGAISTGNELYQSFCNTQQGPVQTTGNTFDMAIQGPGYFVIHDTAGKTYYTRAGNFTISQDGFLTTLGGARVQGDLGNIQLSLDQGPYVINRKGELYGNGRLIDKIQVVQFDNPQGLQKVGDNIYAATQASKMLPQGTPSPQGAATVEQGMLEQSNVNPVLELINNIQGMRLYEALQKNITMQNETLSRAVNDVGKYKA